MEGKKSSMEENSTHSRESANNAIKQQQPGERAEEENAMAGEEGFNYDEFREFITDLAYPKNDADELLSQTPQQVILGAHSLNNNRFNTRIGMNEVSVEEVCSIDMAQIMGFMPRSSEAHRAAVMLMEWEIPISAILNTSWDVTPYATKLLGWKASKPSGNEDGQEYVQAVGRLISLEKQLSVTPGVFTVEERDLYDQYMKDAWLALCTYVKDGDLDSDRTFISTRIFPGRDRNPGRDTGRWNDYIFQHVDSYLESPGNAAMMLGDVLWRWRYNRSIMAGCLAEQGLDSTVAQLSRNHGGKAVNSLFNLAAQISDEEDSNCPTIATLAPHIATITWEKLIAFSELVQRYNLEWATAAFDWES